MGAFNYVLALRAMAEMATVLGNSSMADRYSTHASAATTGFHKAFYNPTAKAYGGDPGAVQSLSTPAIVIDSPPPELFGQVLDTLDSDVRSAGLRVGAVTSKVRSFLRWFSSRCYRF